VAGATRRRPDPPKPAAEQPDPGSAPPAAKSATVPIEVAPQEPGTPAAPSAPIEIEVADPKVYPPGSASTAQSKRGLVILQIGDSHTSADFLTGELRRRLQARYGRGGTGYMTAGHPHIGVRSSTVKITASPGWTYKSLQRPDAHVGEFWLSGYDAIATAAGETMSFASEQPIAFDAIEIRPSASPAAAPRRQARRQCATHRPGGAAHQPVVIRLLPAHGPTDKLRSLHHHRRPGTVSLASVSIYNNAAA
jgi:hypothetical protein